MTLCGAVLYIHIMKVWGASCQLYILYTTYLGLQSPKRTRQLCRGLKVWWHWECGCARIGNQRAGRSASGRNSGRSETPHLQWRPMNPPAHVFYLFVHAHTHAHMHSTLVHTHHIHTLIPRLTISLKHPRPTKAQ